ncbi:hypothetical protein EYF80_038123 [Liparis tanakae]|uniref:Uncharacterized protein n=1 Tax=Liparis tanakae TaxID=230148 RepID=A0A4Z2GFI6_9TELE|nr:hypothetical protein EYF80_038123 [Liparis tanakae]
MLVSISPPPNSAHCHASLQKSQLGLISSWLKYPRSSAHYRAHRVLPTAVALLSVHKRYLRRSDCVGCGCVMCSQTKVAVVITEDHVISLTLNEDICSQTKDLKEVYTKVEANIADGQEQRTVHEALQTQEERLSKIGRLISGRYKELHDWQSVLSEQLSYLLLPSEPVQASCPSPQMSQHHQPPPGLSSIPRDLSEPRPFSTAPWQPPSFLSGIPCVPPAPAAAPVP